MQCQNMHGPPDADAQCRNISRFQKMQIQVQIVGIEQGLRGKCLFKDGVGQAQREDVEPSASPATHDLADQQRSAAVHGCQHYQRPQHVDRQIAKQELRHERSYEEQTDSWQNPFHKLDWVYNYTKSINMKRPPPEGLRARKRREVRKRISDTATRLFLERGFDAVSVEEVACAADVSRATVFNYFECKEDLLLDRAPELAEHVGRALKAARPAGALSALRDALLELVIAGDPLSGAVPAIKWFWPMVTSTPSLRARAQQHGEAFEGELAGLLKLAGLAKDAPLIAAMVVAVWWFAWRKAVEQMLSGRALSRVRAEQRATLERAFAALNRAFPQ